MEVHEDDPAGAGGGGAARGGEAPRDLGEAPSASSLKIATLPTPGPSTVPAAAAAAAAAVSGVAKATARSRAHTQAGSASMAPAASLSPSVHGAAAATSGVAKTTAFSRAHTQVGSAPQAPAASLSPSVHGEDAPPMEVPKASSSLVRRVNASARVASGIWGSSGRLPTSEGNSAAEFETSMHPLEGSTSLPPLKVATATSKPPPNFRVITAPARAAPAQDMWSLPAASRGEVNYSEELQNLTKSVVKIASGLSKVFSGLGLKVVDKEEKEKRAAAEKKAAEQKKLEEEKLIAEERMIADKFGTAKVNEWKRKKQEEDSIKRKEEEKQRMIAFLLSVPGHLIDVSTLFEGAGEVAYGGKDTAVVVGHMIRGIPSLMKGYFNASGRLARTSIMGTGSRGLRMALDRHVVTRSYDSRVAVIDGFGIRKQTIPRMMGGKLAITNMAELCKAVEDFRAGRLYQMLDIDSEQMTFATARDMWCLLCREELTGLLAQDSALPEVALRASMLMQEEITLKSHLNEAELALKEIKSCADTLEQKLRRSTVKERLKVKCD